MTQNALLTRTNLRTPRAAAIAGILFSVLAVAAFWLLWTSVPADPHEPGSWLGTSAGSVALCLNLVPFAGIAFLWFIGVLRDHLGLAGPSTALCDSPAARSRISLSVTR